MRKKNKRVMQQEKELHQPISSGADSQRPIRDRVGVSILPTGTMDALAKIREAEMAGVLQVWIASFAGFADTLTLFTAASVRTERIRLGIAIVPTYPRHPLVMAQQAAAVYDLAPGRIRLGIGPGAHMLVEDWYGLKLSSPLAYLKEYVEVLRGVLWEGKTSYQGKFFQVAFPMSYPAQVPLMISALGIKAFRLAGEIADGAIAGMCPIPYLLKSALPALRAGAEARNRPTPPIIAHVLVALSTDEAAALRVVRQRVQMIARSSSFFAQMFAQAGFAGAVDGNEAELDALARTVMVSGDEATVSYRVQELLASGLDEVQLQLMPIADEEGERKQLLKLVGSL
jgi:alkanesulfonate monooxygenase SsuD/methylene tetrahydromethanopterin reductase-like flavin-dependent oxidoreductase (luciferase family)